MHEIEDKEDYIQEKRQPFLLHYPYSKLHTFKSVENLYVFSQQNTGFFKKYLTFVLK